MSASDVVLNLRSSSIPCHRSSLPDRRRLRAILFTMHWRVYGQTSTSPSLTRVYLQMRLRISGGRLRRGNGFWIGESQFFLAMANQRLFCRDLYQKLGFFADCHMVVNMPAQQMSRAFSKTVVKLSYDQEVLLMWFMNQPTQKEANLTRCLQQQARN